MTTDEIKTHITRANRMLNLNGPVMITVDQHYPGAHEVHPGDVFIAHDTRAEIVGALSDLIVLCHSLDIPACDMWREAYDQVQAVEEANENG